MIGGSPAPIGKDRVTYPVTLTGRVVTLREFREDDAADVYAIIGDDRVTKYLSFDSRTLQQAVEMIAGTIKRASQNKRIEYYLRCHASR